MAFVTAQLAPSDKRLQLASETIIRPLSFGTNWQRIRIGIRAAVNDSLSSIGSGQLILGVMQGTYGWSDPACPDAFGSGMGGSYGGNTYTRGRDSSGNMGYNMTTGQRTLLKQYNTVYISSSNSSTGGFLPVANSGVLGSILVILEKQGATTLYSQACTTNPGNISRATFLTSVESESLTPTGFSSQANTSMTYSGSGLFDSAFIFWRHSTPTIEIADWTVVRYY